MARPTREELRAIDAQLREAGCPHLTNDAIRQSRARYMAREDDYDTLYALAEQHIKPLPPQLVSQANEIILSQKFSRLILKITTAELSPQEFRVCRDRSTGHTFDEIAFRMGLAKSTVQEYWDRTCVKLQPVFRTSNEVAIQQTLIELFGADESNWPALLKRLAEGVGMG